MRSTVLVDTGFLVALFDRTDRLHESAKQMLATRVRDRHLALTGVCRGPALVKSAKSRANPEVNVQTPG